MITEMQGVAFASVSCTTDWVLRQLWLSPTFDMIGNLVLTILIRH